MKQMLVSFRLGFFGMLSLLAPLAITLAEEAPASWTETLAVNGDLRLRYEMIREDGTEDRDRARFRGRIGISAELAPDVRVGFGLATGGDDPVSNNQTFGEGFTTKDIGVNLAYVAWKFHDDWLLTAGKMEKPWFRAGGTT
ncbi:MAG TPA: putative porin, partial [Woeseiaceae bacterium]|nr:putative porin [Woeseiaceae bacterium]